VAEGWKEYWVPTVALLPGVPEIVGARLGAAVTVMLKAGSEVLAWPSETLMRMLEYTPTWPADGVPVSAPVVVLKDAHVGRPVMAKVSLCAGMSASVATGMKA
jgi:hypothetical protein